jgi:hypothetical protein
LGIFANLGTRAFAGPDPIIDIWTLHWVATHLLKDPARLFEGNIFFPARNTVLFSDPLLLRVEATAGMEREVQDIVVHSLSLQRLETDWQRLETDAAEAGQTRCAPTGQGAEPPADALAARAAWSTACTGFT